MFGIRNTKCNTNNPKIYSTSNYSKNSGEIEDITNVRNECILIYYLKALVVVLFFVV